MKDKLAKFVVVFVLLFSFKAYAINFTPEETYNSVVVVYTATGVGSGFFVSENTILTNSHVVENNKTVTIYFYDGTMVKGDVIKTDVNKDLAMIKIDKNVTPLSINSDNLSIGQEVYAIGAPKDMPYTMTKGIISALDRKIGQNTYIQIDASVNSGNSGGPLVDENGKVIGMITLKASDAEGMGFAINTEEINNFIKNVKIPESKENNDNKNDNKKDNDKEFSDKSKPENNDSEKSIMVENSRLEFALFISVVLNILLGLLCILLFMQRRPKKEKNEFDFEIEIED